MNADLIGPLWLVAVGFMLVAIGLSGFVLVDSLRPKRKVEAALRLPEPLWIYTIVMALFLVSIILPQVLRGVSVFSALPVIGAPIAIGFAVAYLLRVVFPKRPQEDEAVVDDSLDEPDEGKSSL